MSHIDVVILCGGLGTRLQSEVPDLPKVLAPVQGKPFLEWLINFYYQQGHSRFILCAGYRSNQLIEYIKKSGYKNMDIKISVEESPLGTGGAIWNAKSYIKSSEFMVVNGDTFCNVEIKKGITLIEDKNAIMAMAMLKKDNASRYGRLTVNETNKIIAFEEKSKIKKSGFINAGTYIMSKALFTIYSPTKPSFSLENDVFPILCQDKRGVYGVEIEPESFIDMGTKDSYKKANTSFLFPSF